MYLTIITIITYLATYSCYNPEPQNCTFPTILCLRIQRRYTKLYELALQRGKSSELWCVMYKAE